jgi:hypothetical protein
MPPELWERACSRLARLESRASSLPPPDHRLHRQASWRGVRQGGGRTHSRCPCSGRWPLSSAPPMAQLGKRNLLPIVRAAQPGLYLDGGSHGEILLPAKYIPAGAVPGGKLEGVCLPRLRGPPRRHHGETLRRRRRVRLSAGGRRQSPHRPLSRLGASARDLLLPAREQDGPLNPGDWVVVQVVLDDKSDRLIASARLNRRLDLTPPPYHEGEAVHLLVASKSPSRLQSHHQPRPPRPGL